MSSNYGIKISKPGYNVKTATDVQLLISSKFPMFKIWSQNTFNLKLPGTRLDGAISSSATTIKVDSTANFRSTGGYFWIFNLLGSDECVEYTSVDSTNFYGCVRGFKGTTNSSFPDNAPVSSGQNELELSHGVGHAPVHFVFCENIITVGSGSKILLPSSLFDGDDLNYADAYVTDTIMHASIEKTGSSFITPGTYDQYNFTYIIMADAIATPYY